MCQAQVGNESLEPLGLGSEANDNVSLGDDLLSHHRFQRELEQPRRALRKRPKSTSLDRLLIMASIPARISGILSACLPCKGGMRTPRCEPAIHPNFRIKASLEENRCLNSPGPPHGLRLVIAPGSVRIVRHFPLDQILDFGLQRILEIPMIPHADEPAIRLQDACRFTQ